MGWDSLLFGLMKAVTLVGRAIVGVVAPVAKTIVQGAKSFVDGVVSGFGDRMRDDPKTALERAERELQQVNAEVMRLVARHRESGGLSDAEKKRWNALRARRDELNDEIASIEKFTTAEGVVEEAEDYKPIVISDDTAHVLQYHVGQSTHNKTCQCGRPMVLQWNRAVAVAGLNDFFWGCSGYYSEVNGRRICTRTQQLTFEDLNLFANLNRPEFEISSQTLTAEAINPVKARRIRQALDSIRDSHQGKRLGIATYRCPVHGESLRLRRKNQAADQLLDQYFLGCPRWLPNNAGCNFLVKLKSAAQISSVLNAEQGNGVLNV